MNTFNIINGKVIYYSCPKCASCTNFGYATLLNMNGNTAPRIRRDTKKLIIIKEGDIPPNAIRYCVVRDPVKRFVSMFKSVIVRGNYVTPMDMDTLMNVIDDKNKTLCVKWPEKRADGWRLSKNHFSSQVSCYGRDPSIFTHIFNINQMDQVKEMLEKHSGILLPNKRLNSTEKMDRLELNEKQINWIKNRYAEDYEIYGKWLG